MEDFEIIEADFQQFYNLNLQNELARGLFRCCRLLLNLPMESRFIRKYSPTKDWSWADETRSRILAYLDSIDCRLHNMTKKKSAKIAKPGEQFQPDYVKEAKEKYSEERRRRVSKESLQRIQDFWHQRNPNAKFIGENGRGD